MKKLILLFFMLFVISSLAFSESAFLDKFNSNNINDLLKSLNSDDLNKNVNLLNAEDISSLNIDNLMKVIDLLKINQVTSSLLHLGTLNKVNTKEGVLLIQRQIELKTSKKISISSSDNSFPISSDGKHILVNNKINLDIENLKYGDVDIISISKDQIILESSRKKTKAIFSNVDYIRIDSQIADSYYVRGSDNVDYSVIVKENSKIDLSFDSSNSLVLKDSDVSIRGKYIDGSIQLKGNIKLKKLQNEHYKVTLMQENSKFNYAGFDITSRKNDLVIYTDRSDYNSDTTSNKIFIRYDSISKKSEFNTKMQLKDSKGRLIGEYYVEKELLDKKNKPYTIRTKYLDGEELRMTTNSALIFSKNSEYGIETSELYSNFKDTADKLVAYINEKGTIRVGDNVDSSLIFEIQRYLGAPETGKYDATTASAIRKFQSIRGISADGIIGKQTMTELLIVANSGEFKQYYEREKKPVDVAKSNVNNGRIKFANLNPSDVPDFEIDGSKVSKYYTNILNQVSLPGRKESGMCTAYVNDVFGTLFGNRWVRSSNAYVVTKNNPSLEFNENNLRKVVSDTTQNLGAPMFAITMYKTSNLNNNKASYSWANCFDDPKCSHHVVLAAADKDGTIWVQSAGGRSGLSKMTLDEFTKRGWTPKAIVYPKV